MDPRVVYSDKNVLTGGNSELTTAVMCCCNRTAKHRIMIMRLICLRLRLFS